VAAEPLIQDESTATASVALAPAAQDALTVATAAGELPAVAQPVEDEGPTVDTPPSVAVVPSAPAPRPQQQETTQVAAAAAPAPVAPAAPQPSAPAAEVTPASAPAAAAPSGAASSEWSMQIASQPSAESAQATYQDLARRYGGILEGRGVNIVRADIEGKGVYYRVRIPAASRDEAIQLCTRYKSSGGSCFVSR
jgi:outer membrane biosynthesis protein TonB